MPIILSNRNTSLVEWMDKPDCDRDMLFATYRHFGLLNRILSRWKWIYQNRIRPELEEGEKYTLLDVGFGGADILRYLDHWSKSDGFTIDITGIETDPRALEYVQSQSWPENFHFKKAALSDLLDKGNTFDFVISNHLIHHLNKEEIHHLLSNSEKICKRKALFNDIERSDFAYFWFKILTIPFFKNSFISDDGLLSIKRSFTFDEMRQLLPMDWKIQRIRPYRLLLEYENSKH